MADVDINKFRASVVRDGSKPSSPGFIVSEGQDPVNPPGTNNYVPYSGATANVELGEYGVEAGFITLDTTPTNTPTDQGTIFWDADDETVDIVLNGYTMKIGEDLFYPVKNQTGSTIAKGVAVMFNGTLGASGRLLIAPFIADGSVASSRFMGVTAEEILNGEDGKVLYFGRVRGIDTDAFNEGDILYASTTIAGGYQTAIPLPPNNIVEVAAVISKSATIGTIFVRPTLGSNINKDEGVKITSVADKNLLQYQSGTSLWENKTLAQVLGGTSSQFVKGDGSLDSTSYGTGTVTSVGLSSATSGVTIGSSPVTTSGTITLAIATASGSQNGLLSSTDWTTFNNKQNALTNPVTGTGTTNYLPKFTGSTTIGDSNLINDASGNLGLGLTPNTWTGTGTKAFQFQNGTLSASNTYGTSLTWNAYFNAGDKYITNGVAGRYLIEGNTHRWDIAPSGTAGNAISFTQAMTLFSTGNLLVGSPSPISDNGARLQVSGRSTVTDSVGGNTIMEVSNTNTTNGFGLFVRGGVGSTSYALNVVNAANTIDLFKVMGSGAATFSSSVNIGASATTGKQLIVNQSGASGYFLSGEASGTEIAYWYYNANVIQFSSKSAARALTFLTTDTERMRITSSGNVGIGTASPSQLLTLGGTPSPQLSIISSTTTGSSEIYFGDSGAVYRGFLGYQHNGDFMQFATAAAERMRITSGGNVLIGTTTVGYGLFTQQRVAINPLQDGVLVGGLNQNFSAYTVQADNNTGTRYAMYIANGSSSGVGYISFTSTATSYVTVSDYRLKTDFKDYNGLNLISKIKTYDFAWKTDKSRSFGVIAHELQEVITYAVNGDKDGETMQGVDYSKLVPIMVKAIQELKQEIDTLKN